MPVCTKSYSRDGFSSTESNSIAISVPNCINCIRYSSLLSGVFCGTSTGTLLLWSLQNKSQRTRDAPLQDITQRPKFLRNFHQGAIIDIDISNNEEILATCSTDETIRVIGIDQSFPSESVESSYGLAASNTSAQSARTTFADPFPSSLRRHNAPVNSVNISSCNRFLLSASRDRTIKIWKLPKAAFIASYYSHTNWVRCARFSPTISSLFASCGDDFSVKIWDVAHKVPVVSMQAPLPLNCVSSNSLSSNVVATNHNSRKDTFTKCCFSPHDSKLVIVGGSKRCVYLWDIRQRQLSASYHLQWNSSIYSPEHSRSQSSGIKNCTITSLEAEHDGIHVGVATEEGDISVIDLRSGLPAFQASSLRGSREASRNDPRTHDTMNDVIPSVRSASLGGNEMSESTLFGKGGKMPASILFGRIPLRINEKKNREKRTPQSVLFTSSGGRVAVWKWKQGLDQTTVSHTQGC